jgi:radical SAM-linked protein
MQNNEYILQAWYEKKGMIKYSAHRDIINIFYISLIRAKLPLHYTEGFTKKPKLSFSPALSLGVSSECEFVNIYLNKDIEINDGLLKTLNGAFPAGINFLNLRRAESDINKTVEKIKAFKYRCDIETDFENNDPAAEFIKDKIASIAGCDKIMVDYNDRLRDIKPYIESCALISEGPEIISFSVTTSLIGGSSIKAQLVLNYILGEYKKNMIYCAGIEKEEIIYRDQN